MVAGRLIIDTPASGPWNMAVDEALLRSAAEGSQCTLRFYGWSEPTLSLGYFQSVAERRKHPESQSCPVVRRSTGGGAIVHDREVTYSFTTPIADRVGSAAQQLYAAFHTALAETLAQFGARATLCKAEKATRRRDEPFLCFERRAAGDVLLEGHKIAGSAQRRHRRAVLQHGSILLCRSTKAPQLLGITDLIGFAIERAALIARWQERLAASLSLELVPSGLTEKERTIATQLVEEKFGGRRWTERR